MTTKDTCPCGGFDGAVTLGQCCGPFIDGELPPTCEQLMRSRYTAFVLRDADHLWRTWHPRTRPTDVGPLDGMTWTGLTVTATDAGGPDDNHGTVDFLATFRAGGQQGRVHEHSRFERRAGRWFYVDGDDLDEV